LPQWFAVCLISEVKPCREKIGTSFYKKRRAVSFSLYSRQIIMAKGAKNAVLPQWFAAFPLITHLWREAGTIYARVYTSSHSLMIKNLCV